MRNREFERELKKAREESKKNVADAKNKLKKEVDNAELAIIIQTDKCSALVGNKYDTSQLLCNLFSHLLQEGAFTKEEVIDLLNMADDEKKESTNETLDRLSTLLDKAIKLQELQNKNKDEE